MDQPIVAVLNYRWSGDRVRDFIEQYYIAHNASHAERLAYARQAKNNPYRAEFASLNGGKWEGRITCGHNPHLLARVVLDLYMVPDARDPDQRQGLRWTEIQPPSHLTRRNPTRASPQREAAEE